MGQRKKGLGTLEEGAGFNRQALDDGVEGLLVVYFFGSKALGQTFLDFRDSGSPAGGENGVDLGLLKA